jgi:[acyl-carrier-protein] S-malonyltransferase
MKKVAALFPGQGSQNVGMSKTLVEAFPWTRQIFEEASEAIKSNLYKLCAEGPSDELQLTFNAQPAILTTSYAWFRILQKTLDFKPMAGAGHSLGEYSALLCSGALTLSEAVRLVRKRGELMQSAVPAGKGKMAAVLGLSDEAVVELCKAASESETSLVVPANFNAPSQVVIAGHAGAVERAQALASDPKNPQWKARKVIPLNVSAPFHCPLMKPVAETFVPHLQAIQWQKIAFPIVNNLDGQWRETGDWVSLLRDQIDHSVLWTKCATTLSGHGAEVMIEMGPGKVLTGLVKRIVENVKLFNLETVEDLKAFEREWK